MTLALTAITHAMAMHNATGAGKRRNPWATAGLNAITLGLYSVYWWYVVNRELRDFGRDAGEAKLEKEPALSALAFFFGACLFVPLVWTAVTTARRIRLAQDVVGTAKPLAVWFPVALLTAAALTQLFGGESTAEIVALVAATVALRTAAVAYMQYALNEIWDGAGAVSGPPPSDPPVQGTARPRLATLAVCAVCVLGLASGAAAAKVSRGGTLNGSTSQGYPATVKVSRSGRMVREVAITVLVRCQEGGFFAPLKARGLPISPGGRFSGRLEDTQVEEGTTVHLFESIAGRFNTNRTKLTARSRVRVSAEAEDGSSEVCDSGSVKFHVAR